jgi:hypothetical protein
MKNDELLEPTTAPSEEDLALQPRWVALRDGAISEKEMAALEEEAQRSEAARHVFDAYRPLARAARERITARVMASVREQRPPPDPALRPRPPAVVPVPAPSRPRVPPRLIALLGGAVLASAVALAVNGCTAPLPETAQLAMSISAEKTVRSDAPSNELPHLGPGSTFTAQLRPSQAIEGKLEARAFLLRDERARPWSVPIELAPGGAARISGTKEALFPGVGAGRWEVVMIVGRPGKLPSAEELARLTPEERRKGTKYYRVQGQEIELRDSHEP